jgi:hypothetical protein
MSNNGLLLVLEQRKISRRGGHFKGRMIFKEKNLTNSNQNADMYVLVNVGHRVPYALALTGTNCPAILLTPVTATDHILESGHVTLAT